MIIFSFFFIIFLTNFIILFPYRINSDLISDQFSIYDILSIVFDILLIFYFFYYIYFELKQITNDVKEYLSSGYNYIDIGLIISLLVTLVLDLLYVFQQFSDESIVKLVSSITAFLFWLRIISYLRGFEGTAFMIHLIVQVVADIRYFLLLIGLFTLSFICSMYHPIKLWYK